MTNDPLRPLVDSPDAKASAPLTPDVADEEEETLNDPLDVALPAWLDIDTDPPSDSLEPDEITTRPDDPAAPTPTTTLMLPAAPLEPCDD
jgi:hypothetical protein